MIELTRQQVLVLRSTIRQALGLTGSHRSTCCVTFKTTPEELSISARHGEVAITWRISGQYRAECFALPIEAMAICEGRQQDMVCIERVGETATLRWTDAAIPQTAEYPLIEPIAMPEDVSDFVAVEHEFLSAMGEASATTESGSLRYALSYIRLRGSDGQIAATDSRQALLQSGFHFPWADAVLVPATAAFTTRIISRAEATSLTRTDDWVFVRADAWTIALQIEKQRRFPDIDAQLPAITAATTVLQLAENDAGFLICAASRLPGADDSTAPVTLDLNGTVIVRAKSEEHLSATELLLSNSRKRGQELQVSTDRDYLKRAVELGFREIHLRDADLPAYCRSDRRAYIWALLGKDAVLKRDSEATRIQSPLSGSTTQGTSGETLPAPVAISGATPFPMNRTAPTASQDNQRETQPKSTQPEAMSLADLITEGEALRMTLRAVLSKTRVLISGLKQQRRQSRTQRTARRPLRAVQASEG